MKPNHVWRGCSRDHLPVQQSNSNVYTPDLNKFHQEQSHQIQAKRFWFIRIKINNFSKNNPISKIEKFQIFFHQNGIFLEIAVFSLISPWAIIEPSLQPAIIIGWYTCNLVVINLFSFLPLSFSPQKYHISVPRPDLKISNFSKFWNFWQNELLTRW